ncbi:MAG TPA: aminotransferase class I/II-fold pyridoxal phosphate-dependent enzyme [Gemmataceae bacterium]|nr:aminotransferase class I/II-fold pyridoxal phosphate-dependent enzyme [Gemmataceae bacterium]
MSTDLPALLGGAPVRPGGPPPWPAADSDVLKALQEAHADGSWGQYLGRHVPALEALLAEIHGASHALTCASGTLAVETAVRAVGVDPGDEVILAAYDFESNFLNVHEVGATPVLVDISPTNGCIDPAAMEAAITPATRAIIVSHLHGGLVPMSRVMKIAASRPFLSIIEDAAQTSGAQVEGRMAGTWGDVGILSFGGSKMLTAGRGGALLTRHAEVFQRAKVALARGMQQWAAMSQLQAAVLLPQVRKMSDQTVLRHQRVVQLVQALQDIPGLRPFRNELPDSRPGYYKLGFFLDEGAFGLSRDMFVKALRAEGMAFDPGFRALHVGRTASRYKAPAPLPHAEMAGKCVVALHHPVLSLGPEDVEQVAVAVRKIYRNAERLR